ncbi:MAG: T9SS type A sorting domain-containing protein [Arcticibacter sp.]|jgi:hypothetical protein
MKRFISFLFSFLTLTVVQAQQDSTYSYVYDCDSCGTFETISFEPIELETEVDISSEILPDTSTSTLAQFSSVSLRKASTSSGVLSSSKTHLNIYPIPVKSNFFINIESDRECIADIMLFDLFGRQAISYKQNLTKGMNVIEQSSSKLISGNYFVKASFNNNFYVKKLMIQK